jgi:hypothetical protein
LTLYYLCCADLVLTEDQLKIYALADIELNLLSAGKSLADYPPMPRADPALIPDLENRLIHDEMNYNRGVLADEHSRLMSTMTDEQRQVYDRIMSRVDENKPGLFFFVWIWRDRKNVSLESHGSGNKV